MTSKSSALPAIATVSALVGLVLLVRKRRHRSLSKRDRARLVEKHKAAKKAAIKRARRIADATKHTPSRTNA